MSISVKNFEDTKVFRIIRVPINGHDDRNKMVNSLANSGHKVWIDNKFVCFELEEPGDKSQ